MLSKILFVFLFKFVSLLKWKLNTICFHVMTTSILGYLPQELLGTSVYEYYYHEDLAHLSDTHRKGKLWNDTRISHNSRDYWSRYNMSLNMVYCCLGMGGWPVFIVALGICNNYTDMFTYKIHSVLVILDSRKFLSFWFGVDKYVTIKLIEIHFIVMS